MWLLMTAKLWHQREKTLGCNERKQKHSLLKSDATETKLSGSNIHFRDESRTVGGLLAERPVLGNLLKKMPLFWSQNRMEEVNDAFVEMSEF